jgi:hypothetical protein
LVKLDAAQAQILANAMKLVLEEFTANEFETRMGCTESHARDLLDRLAKAQA